MWAVYVGVGACTAVVGSFASLLNFHTWGSYIWGDDHLKAYWSCSFILGEARSSEKESAHRWQVEDKICPLCPSQFLVPIASYINACCRTKLGNCIGCWTPSPISHCQPGQYSGTVHVVVHQHLEVYKFSALDLGYMAVTLKERGPRRNQSPEKQSLIAKVWECAVELCQTSHFK